MTSQPGKNAGFHHDHLHTDRSIRTLELVPSESHGAVLEVLLQEISLDSVLADNSTYEALSYVWGSPTGTRPIICNGEVLKVTPNCEAALRRLRLPDRSRVLWVDAICIDQSSSENGQRERSTQVPMMGEIYNKASRTICWLGEGGGFTREVLDLLSEIGNGSNEEGVNGIVHLEGMSRCIHGPWTPPK